MSTITFDTLKFVEKLEKAGVSREQAKAEAEALAEVFETGSAKLATQNDIKAVQGDIKALEERSNGKFTLLQWMIGFSLALNTAILLKLMSH
jgi:hypothetical protein